MTTAELERIVRGAVWPAGSIDVVALVDVMPGGRLPNGSPSGIGVVTRFGAAFFDGLRQSPPIAMFDRQTDAHNLIRIMKGGTALGSAPRSVAARSQDAGSAERGAVPSVEPLARRSKLATPSGPGIEAQGVAATRSADAPAVTAGARAGQSDGDPAGSGRAIASASPGPTCKACGRPLPESGRGRQTCDDACRQAFHRGQRYPFPAELAARSVADLSRLPAPSAIPTGATRRTDPVGPGAAQLALPGRHSRQRPA